MQFIYTNADVSDFCHTVTETLQVTLRLIHLIAYFMNCSSFVISMKVTEIRKYFHISWTSPKKKTLLRVRRNPSCLVTVTPLHFWCVFLLPSCTPHKVHRKRSSRHRCILFPVVKRLQKKFQHWTSTFYEKICCNSCFLIAVNTQHFLSSWNLWLL